MNNIVKKAGILLAMGIFFASCASKYEAIGKVNVLSDRPIKAGITYKRLTSHSGGTKKELKNSKTECLDAAVKHLISSVSGGCFLTNVTIYVVDNGYYAVSGDVWGIDGNDTLQRAQPNVLASIAKH